MKDLLPTARDMKRIAFKTQRRKNLLPEHAVLTSALNDEVVSLRTAIQGENDEARAAVLGVQLQNVLVRKRKLEEKGFEDLALKLREYIVDQPAVIRLAQRTRSQDNRQLMRFDKQRGTVTLFDRYVALLLSRTFSTKLHGRDQLIRSLLNALKITVRSSQAKAHRSIIRLDIEEFFGSIDHQILLEKLRSHAGVPLFVLKHVEALLAACARITGKRVGIPQGVPSSSVLAEIYLENLDFTLKQHSSVVFFGRYVDDVIIVCHGREAGPIDEIVDHTLKSLGLTRNRAKSTTHYYPAGKQDGFDYLGYGFGFNKDSGQLSTLDLSAKKFDRYDSGLKNLETHLAKVICGAEEQKIDLLLEAVNYLFYPHATIADSDSLRIVTGQAYSSRFILHEGLRAPRLNSLLNRASGSISNSLSWLSRCVPPQAPRCYCCQVEVHRFDELSALAGARIEQSSVLGKQAVPHVDDVTRREVDKLLWNLHVAK